MRRSFLSFVLIALALLGRMLAPVAVEAHGFDPLTSAICTHDGATPAPLGGDEPGTAHDGDCDHSCCHVEPMLLTPPVAHAGPVRLPSDIRWLIAGVARIAPFTPPALRARGPPLS